jgi:biotin carboxyl carrier protein
MLIRKMLSTGVTLVILAGVAGATYATRDKWLPYVLPEKQAAKPGSHGHSHDDADPHAGHDHAHDHAAGDRVKLTPQAQANLKLDVDVLNPQEYWRTVLIPGVVVDRPGESDRGVTARLAGVVSEIKARPGDTVRAGDPLFVVQLVSEFVQSTQNDLARAAQELRIATAKRDRTAEQVRQGTTAEARLIEDEAQVKRFTTQINAYRRQLQVFGLTPAQVDQAEKGNPVTQVVIVAPAGPTPSSLVSTQSGSAGEKPSDLLYEVQELKVQLGESVQAGQTLLTLANHQRLFVEGRAFKSEAAVLARAAELKVPVMAEFADEVAGEWPPQEPLTIHHLSNQVDPATRTFAFYLPLDNQPRTFERDSKTHFVWRYRPGQRVRLKVPVEKLGDEVYVLPAGAVVREGPEAFVFVQNGDLFERKPVHVLYEDRAEVVLANDGSVGPGQFVVRNQAAAINRALKAAAGGGGGGHDHAGHSHDH